MDTLAEIFNVLSNPTRLQIYHHILKEACECDLDNKKGLSGNCVSKISEALDLNQPTVSNHIKELVRADLVDIRKVGNVNYLFGKHSTLDEVIAFAETSKKELSRTPNSFQ
jgi:DNA-binding transcriptional ArsR family regulator